MHASYSAKVLNLAHRNWERNDSGCGAGHISRSHTSTPMVGQQNNAVIPKNSWSELEITGGVSNLSPGVFEYTHLTRLSLRSNNLTCLPKQISNLANLTTLDASGNRLQSIPAEMGKMINLRELYLNNNCLKILPFELGKLFQLQKIGIKGNPLPNKYFNFCNETNGTQKLINFLFDHLPTSCTTVPERHWVPLETCDSSKPLVFSILSYNVLCEKNCTRQLYPYCQSWALAWDYRKKIIIGELRRYQADILCLQEVETDQFYQFFQPELSKEGYSGIFSPKSRAKTMQENERKHVDGCAIFYKSAKFQVVSERLVEFNQIAIEAAGGSHDMINRVMTKDNIGLAVLLQTTKEAWPNGPPPDIRVNQPLLVATCHVHWDPEFCDVKIIQTMMLIKELKNLIKGAAPDLRPNSSNDSKLNCTSVPMVICGDMNSVPESGVVEFLKLGQVNSNHKEFKDMAYKDCLLKLSTSTDKEIYTHNFRLKEAYLKDTLPFTNFTYDFKDIIDYIFYSYDTIRCLGVLGPPDDKWFEGNNVVGCPHPQIPSDHLPLLAQLMIVPSQLFLFPSDNQQQQQQQQQQHHHHHHHHFHGRP